MSFYQAYYRDVTARKQHDCTFCGRPIEQGESHVTWGGVMDGRWFHCRAHHACAAAWDGLWFDLEEPFLDPHTFRTDVLEEID